MKRIAFYLIGILCITACNNEVIIHTGQEKDHTEEGPSIELRMPDATKVSVYSSPTGSEHTIDSIWVLEFNSAGTLLNSQLIAGSKIINNGYATQLLPQLSFTPQSGNRIICIANSDAKTSPHPAASSITTSNINIHFPLALNEYYYGGKHLPMYGELTWTSSTYTCVMTRAVAKIQIQIGTNAPDVTGNFTADNVSYTIHNMGIGGYIQPTSPLQGIPGNTVTKSFSLLNGSTTDEAETTAYLYEYPTSTGNGMNAGEFNINRQHVILKKSGTPDTYYRLDFYDHSTGKYIDTERNHHYLFTIKNISSEGYATPSEAQNNNGSNLVYEVNSNGIKTISNGQYAVITSGDTAYITSAGAVTDTIIATAKYYLPAGVSLGAGTTNTVTVTNENPAGSITLGATGITALAAAEGNIKVTVTAAFTEGTVTIKLGNITHHLYVKRKP